MELFEQTLAAHDDARAAANWIVNEVSGHFEDGKAAGLPFGGAELAELLALVGDGTISGKAGKEVLATMLRDGGAPREIVEEKGLQQVTDPGAVAPIVEQVLEANPDKVEEYRGGRKGLLGFFVGQVMRESGGTASPELVQELVRERLDSSGTIH